MSPQSIFPAPRELTCSPGFVTLNGGVHADAGCAGDVEAFLHILRRSDFHSGQGNLTLKRDPSLSEDAYAVRAADGQVTVCASGRRGFVFAAATLSQLLAPDGKLPCLTMTDEPYLPLRGAHFYLPPKDGIAEFCRILDALAYLKYNTLFLEIGGGVEYRSHPELADSWRRFCREARNYAGGPQGLQGSQAYWKDSTHVELAGGDVLSREQLMQIVRHARFLGMEVIPEIQALSHSYYLTLAHREIAEIPYEPYPDTYCPMNEASYRLYTDIATELHELIGFDRVSIGHDEIRVLGVCPKCRGKSGADLLAFEINRLHEIYKNLGVKLFMWGESLQNFPLPGGRRMGDALVRDDAYGRHYEKPACFAAIDRIPTDIILLDWCYALGYHSEEELEARGFREIYGNFRGTTFHGFEDRSRRSNVIGAEVSTWCVSDENELARNGWFFEFAFSSAVLWRDDFCDEVRDEWMQRTNLVMPVIRSIVRGLPGSPEGPAVRSLLLPQGEQKSVSSAAVADALTLPFNADGNSVSVPIGRRCEELTLLHAADFGEEKAFPRVYTWFFRDFTPYRLGFCSIMYEDGVTQTYPIEYGVQIGNLHGGFAADLPAGIVKTVEDESQNDHAENAGEFRPTTVVLRDEWIGAAAYFTDAIPLPAKENGARMVYGWTMKNPRPEAVIRELRLFAEQRAAIRLFGILL